MPASMALQLLWRAAPRPGCKLSFWETLINYLCGRIAKLQCRAVRYCQQVQLVPVDTIYRNLNIFLYMSRFLRSVRLALHPAQIINQGFLWLGRKP